MKDMFKNNVAIIVAILLPLLVVGAVLASVYLPNRGIHPTHDVLFATNNRETGYYTNEYVYVLKDKQVQREDVPFVASQTNTDIKPKSEQPHLFVFEIDSRQIREVSLEEANTLTVVKEGNLSPEGFVISAGYKSQNSGIFDLFGGYGREYGFRFEKDSGSRFLEVINPYDIYYYRDVQILGSL